MATTTTRYAARAHGAGELTYAALAAAERGWRVFPVRPGAKKPPAVKQWEDRATDAPDRIRRCWEHDAYNVGIATGPSRLIVIDLDVPHRGERPPSGWDAPGVTDGADAFALLAERHDHRLPLDTYTVTTPTGGTHLYFTAPDGVELRNTNGHPPAGGRIPETALGWLIDTRASGGYVIAPGSVTAGGTYVAVNDTAPAPLPDWLAALLTAPRPVATHLGASPRPDDTVRDLDAYADQALKGEADRVRAACTGGRNHALNKAAWNLGRLIARGALTEDAAYAVLTDAAAGHVGTDGFTQADVDATIRAAFRAATDRTGRAA